MAHKNYWLVKSEPDSYSIDDLAHDTRTAWTGVRNYQARNFMRDQMQVGDVVFFYHSNTRVPGIVGEASVCSRPHPDETAQDPKDAHFDPRSSPENPRWYSVDLCFAKRYAHVLTLAKMRNTPALSGMLILRGGNRLSVTPVSAEHATCVRQFVKNTGAL